MSKCANCILFVIAMMVVMNMARASNVFAAPGAQATPAGASPTPTDEPPKPPYVFPVPIFIPTFPGDTPSAAAAPRTPSQPTGQSTYIVQSGDSPWLIAEKVYGNGSKYPLIMSANALSDTTRLRVGMTLKIPPVEGTQPLPAPGTPPAAGPTALAPAPAATATTPVGNTLTPTATSTPSRVASSSVSDLATAALNIIVALLALGAFVAAVLAFLIYTRTRRMRGLNSPKRGLQIPR